MPAPASRIDGDPGTPSSREESNFRHLIEANSDAMMVIDSQGLVRFANPAAEKMFNRSAVEMLDQPFGYPVSTDTDMEIDLLPHHQPPLTAEMRATDTTWEDQPALLASLRDITARKKDLERLHHQATHDALTGLPNRTAFDRYLQRAIKRAQRQGQLVAVLFLDLDGFKKINDTFGHVVGDQLLHQVAHRIKKELRAADILARLGGDEFTICLEGLESPDGAAVAADKILHHLRRPFDLGEDQAIRISTSIGISLYPENGTTPLELLQCADRAMYEAKNAGRNTLRFFGNRLNRRTRISRLKEERLGLAMERRELSMLFQPRFALSSGKIVAAEALLRWREHTTGWRRPASLIKVASESGLIQQLSDWALTRACRAAIELRNGEVPLPMVVNLAPQQFDNINLCEQVKATLERTGLPGGFLHLEIPTSFFARHERQALRLIRELREIGVKPLLDDFGADHFSILSLAAAGLDQVTLARACLDGVPQEGHPTQAMRGLLALLRELSPLHAVVKGVESAEQFQFLSSLDNNLQMQGFHLAAPMTFANLQKLLHDQQA